MKKPRNLLVLVGPPQHAMSVLEELQYKGLITNPYWNPITAKDVEAIFKCNKSVVCSADDYSGRLPPTAITINIVNVSSTPECNVPNTIFLKDSDSPSVQFERIVNSLNLDIGDHKSNSSGMTDGPTIKDCAYCKYLDGNIERNERTLYRSENFFVIPTLGQFIPGYLLIIPYKHVMSNGELEPEVLEEFENVLEDIEYILRLTYPSAPGFLVWENGSGKSGIGKAKDSLVHSHVHIAPTTLNSEKIEEMSGFDFDEISLKDLPNYKAHSYLLLRTPDKSKWKINNDPALYIPRQYVRQLIAEKYNIPGDAWNWRTHPFVDMMHQTVIDVVAALRDNKDLLSQRIQKNTSFLFSTD